MIKRARRDAVAQHNQSEEIKPGRYTLEVRPQDKKAGAVMDLRAITLKPLGA